TRRGEYRKAIDELEPLVVRYGELGVAQSRQVQSDLLGLIAEAQRRLGQVDEARKTYARIERIAQELQDTARLAKLAHDQGDLLRDASRWQEAGEQYATSAELALRASDKKQAAESQSHSAQAFWRMGRKEDALEHDKA